MHDGVGFQGGGGARASVPFSLKPILVDLEGGRYIGLILPISLTNLVTGRRSAVSGVPRNGDGSSGVGGGNGNNKKPTPKVGATAGPAQVQARYEAHLPSLYLLDG